jgi:hypothetical protein
MSATYTDRPRFDLQLLGDLCLRDLRTGARVGEPRRKPLLLLAVLVAAAPDTVERDALLPLLWPELDLPRARRTLSQTLYALRQELDGEDVVVGTTHLTVSPWLTSDLARWRSRHAAGDQEGCRREYGGPFLDGVHVRGGAAFEQWVAAQRARIASVQRAERPTPATAPVVPPTLAAAPARARPRLRHLLALAVPALLVAGVTVLSARNANRPPAPPTTMAEESRLSLRQAYEARLAATDSSRIGRILVLSTLNRTRDPGLDSLLPSIDETLHSYSPAEFAQRIPREISQQLERQQREWRWPSTTEMHMARLFQWSGAGLLVQPVLQSGEDGPYVTLMMYRSIAHTPAARAGAPNVESERVASVRTLAVDGREVRLSLGSRAASAMVRFTRSMERCDSASHVGAYAAPWCWSSRTTLDLVPGTSAERQRQRSEADREYRVQRDSLRRARLAER